MARLSFVSPSSLRSPLSGLLPQVSDLTLKSQVSGLFPQVSGIRSLPSSIRSKVSSLKYQVSALSSFSLRLQFTSHFHTFQQATTNHQLSSRNPPHLKTFSHPFLKSQVCSLKPQSSSLSPQVSALKSQVSPTLSLSPQVSSLKSLFPSPHQCPTLDGIPMTMIVLIL